MQLEDEEYYFKISPASDIADGSPNTAHGKTAESTSGKAASATARDTVVATVADGAENRASDDGARMERSLDTACDINAETTCKAASATTSEATSGATKEITSEQAGDAPCEYPVYVRRVRIGFSRTIFTGFWKNFKMKFNAKSGEAKWDCLTFLKMINLTSTCARTAFSSAA
ncbi:hypothetical protein [uncultured Campylobacter sp.]|uniref:hypothetical protein n=1 Tax=uncultured Campylobacter sp. TaxID=218934 RepID=UPI00261DA975|nr:hypothetical protein [uncultured Campylobacter sp.]